VLIVMVVIAFIYNFGFGYSFIGMLARVARGARAEAELVGRAFGS